MSIANNKSIVDKILEDVTIGPCDMPDPSEERRLKHIRELINKSNIPPRFDRATFELINCQTIPQDVKQAYLTAKIYADNWKENKEKGIGMLFVGRVGRMKTTLAIAVANAVMRKGSSAYFTPMAELLDDLLSCSGADKMQLMDKLYGTQLLILDDLGTEYPNDWVTNKVDAVITHRYNYRKPTIITSNLSVGGIRSRYQERIFDRLKSSSVLVVDSGANSLRGTVDG